MNSSHFTAANSRRSFAAAANMRREFILSIKFIMLIMVTYIVTLLGALSPIFFSIIQVAVGVDVGSGVSMGPLSVAGTQPRPFGRFFRSSAWFLEQNNPRPHFLRTGNRNGTRISISVYLWFQTPDVGVKARCRGKNIGNGAVVTIFAPAIGVGVEVALFPATYLKKAPSAHAEADCDTGNRPPQQLQPRGRPPYRACGSSSSLDGNLPCIWPSPFLTFVLVSSQVKSSYYSPNFIERSPALDGPAVTPHNSLRDLRLL